MNGSERLVVGLDATRGGWVAVVLRGSRFAAAARLSSAGAALSTWPGLEGLGIDIPIGLFDARRDADTLARKALGKRGSTVFPAPSAAAIACDTYAEANAAHRAALGVGLSKQSYMLRERILDAARVAGDARVMEVHPELVFARLAGEPLPPKKCWDGQRARTRVLAARGVVLPEELGDAGTAPTDDVLDAAAAAIGAADRLDGVGRCFPDPPTQHDPSGRAIVVHG